MTFALSCLSMLGFFISMYIANFDMFSMYFKIQSVHVWGLHQFQELVLEVIMHCEFQASNGKKDVIANNKTWIQHSSSQWRLGLFISSRINFISSYGVLAHHLFVFLFFTMPPIIIPNNFRFKPQFSLVAHAKVFNVKNYDLIMICLFLTLFMLLIFQKILQVE